MAGDQKFVTRDTMVIKSDGIESLNAEVTRSRIYQSALEHLDRLGVKPGEAGMSWGLDFTLHFGLGSSADEVRVINQNR